MKHFGWAFLWAMVVVLFCIAPQSDFQELPRFEGIDKLVHTGFFFVFTVLMYYGAIRRSNIFGCSMAVHFYVLLFACLFALFTEFLQWKFFTYRSADIWDLFADLVGIGMGMFAYLTFYLGNYYTQLPKK